MYPVSGIINYMPKIPTPLTILLGKAVREATKLRGGGSALPGLFVESIDKDFIKNCLSQLPQGVVLISGTNGKTTTTKMVVELLEGQGLRVFTNRTGSNFTRGVAAALLGDITPNGILRADIAVLELDEAHAVHFVKTIQPRHSLLLNVMRDQLDRFGEIDATAKLLQTVAEHTSNIIVINREDPRLLAVSKNLPKEKVRYFGLEPQLRHQFPSDDDMRGSIVNQNELPQAVATLEHVDGHTATFTANSSSHTVTLRLEGIYNIFNAVAAVALVNSILAEKLNTDKLLHTLASVTPAFGRGEKLIVKGQPLELVLVKNPGGFRLGLQSFLPNGYQTMIAINDNYADGRDMSWLWDVDFESLKETGVACVSGVRAYDMALRLQYDEIQVSHVDSSLPSALRKFINDYPATPKRIYCSYTAMLALRRELSKLTTVKVVS
jgi:lipid II isoglutaminyl synthase (glutamine-hydrolysing)